MTGTVRKAACALYGDPITYSGTKDTHETQRQVKVKNKTFGDLGCFAPPPPPSGLGALVGKLRGGR